jgi:hypothetical protein
MLLDTSVVPCHVFPLSGRGLSFQIAKILIDRIEFASDLLEYAFNLPSVLAIGTSKRG